MSLHIFLSVLYCFDYSSFYAKYIMRNAGLDEAQAGIKILGRNSSDLR